MDVRPVLTLTAALALASCGRASPPAEPSDPDRSVVRGGVAYTADVLVMESFPVQLRGVVRMENTSSDTVKLELGSGCPALLRVYRDGESGDAAWDQGAAVECTMELRVVDLAPGETVAEEVPPTDAARILGDSLPDGTYRLVAYVRGGVDAVEVPVGPVELAVPR